MQTAIDDQTHGMQFCFTTVTHTLVHSSREALAQGAEPYCDGLDFSSSKE